MNSTHPEAATQVNLDEVRQLLVSYNTSTDTDEQDGIANTLVMGLSAMVDELQRLRDTADSILADADRRYYERRNDDWFLIRLAAARKS